MKSLTHYCQVLAVVPPVTPQRLKRAYRNAVKIWHPDRFAYNSELQNTAQEKLEEINQAYEALRSLITEGQDHWSNSGSSREKRSDSSPAEPDDSASDNDSPPSGAPIDYGNLCFWRRHWLVTISIGVIVLVGLFQLMKPPTHKSEPRPGIYVYKDKQGVLIFTNTPTHDGYRRVILDASPEAESTKNTLPDGRKDDNEKQLIDES